MPSWWPFSDKGATGTVGHANGTVPMIGSVADSDAFRGVKDGTLEENKENTRGIGAHQTEGFLQRRQAVDKKDMRAIAIDTDSVDSLVHRFSTEFRNAEHHMQDREKNKKLINLYDYDNDDRFQQWKKDQQQVNDRLKIHWIDTMIDRPTYGLVYFLRVFTTAGLFYGAGRTMYLYRTMDKVYAKLNGVTLGRIAFNEVTLSVAKGGFTAVAATLGLTTGDAVAALLTVITSKDVSRPERHWGNVVASGFMSGLFAGLALSAMHYTLLSPWGMQMGTLACTAVGTAAGFVLGYGVYKPFAETRQHALYDPYWRPWNLRVRRDEGPSLIRGKFV